MNEGLTPLEAAVLGWMRARSSCAALAGQIAAALDGAAVTGREWTGAGCFVSLAIPRSLPPVPTASLGDGWPLPGPELEAPEIDGGGSSLLWGADGYFDCIELFAYGAFFREGCAEAALIEPLPSAWPRPASC